MDNKSAISQVKETLERIQSAIVRQKSVLLDLENQERRFKVALEVLESLPGPGPHVFRTGHAFATLGTSTTVSVGSSNAGIVAGTGTTPPSAAAGAVLSSHSTLFKRPTRHLILEQFVAGETLTRVQVVERINSTGESVNENTVATTLSKLTTEGTLEKAEDGYRLKGAALSAEDTESDDDLA